MVNYVETTAWANNDVSNLAYMSDNDQTEDGVLLQADSSWVQSMIIFEIKVGITGSPAGTLRCHVYTDNSGTPGTPIASATNTYQLNTISNGDTLTWTFASISLVAGNVIAIDVTGTTTDGSNYINILGKTGSVGYDSNVKNTAFQATVPEWVINTSYTPNARMGYSNTGARLPPPPIVLSGL